MSIASEITRLQAAKTSIISALTSKGVTVSAGAKYGDLAALITGLGGTPAYPSVTYTGKYDSRLIVYGTTLYVEYELFSSGTFTLGGMKNYVADITAVGAGGKGGCYVGTVISGSYIQRGGTGGGAGYQTHTTQTLTVGAAIPVVIAASGGAATSFDTLTAASGGDGTITTTLPSGYAGNYYLYGDKTIPCGFAGAPGAGSAAGATSKGGAGSNGFGLNGDTIRAQNGLGRVSMASTSNVDSTSGGAGGVGFGAGGGGQGGVFSQSAELKDQFGNVTGYTIFPVTMAAGLAALGTQGVVLLRLAL